MENLNTRTVKHARKHHLCDWCLRRIEVGESYRYTFVVDGGDSHGWHECLDCTPYVDEMMAQDWKHSIEMGYTTTDYMEWMAENHPDVLPHRKEE